MMNVNNFLQQKRPFKKPLRTVPANNNSGVVADHIANASAEMATKLGLPSNSSTLNTIATTMRSLIIQIAAL